MDIALAVAYMYISGRDLGLLGRMVEVACLAGLAWAGLLYPPPLTLMPNLPLPESGPVSSMIRGFVSAVLISLLHFTVKMKLSDTLFRQIFIISAIEVDSLPTP